MFVIIVGLILNFLKANWGNDVTFLEKKTNLFFYPGSIVHVLIF